MADAFALASAAAERRKASAPRKQVSAQTAYTCLRGALPRLNISKRQRLLVRRGNGWHAPFGASPPFFAGGEFIFWCVVVRQSSDAKSVARTISAIRPRAVKRSGGGGPCQRVQPEVAGPMTGSGGRGGVRRCGWP